MFESEKSQPIGENLSLSNQERESHIALHYPYRPILFDAKTCFANGALQTQGKNITISSPSSPEITVPPDRIFSLVQATMFGLNEALVRAERGHNLRDAFDTEMQTLNNILSAYGHLRHYGTWAFYPRSGNLAQFVPEPMHHLAALASNSSLYLDPEMSLSFTEVRDIFRHLTPAVIGLSVGNSIAKSLVQALRPDNLIIGDPALYKMTNVNRVLGLLHNLFVLSETEMESTFSLHGLRNKAQVLAEQLHAEDPYPNIFCYQDGATLSNLPNFLGGNRVQPCASIVIDVCDNPSVKLAAAIEARNLGIRLIRVTDAGTSVWIDIRAFDLDRSLPISPGISDDELFHLHDQAERSRADFFAFASALVGPEHLRTKDEFSALVKGRLPKTTASIPQLGATTAVGGGLTANVVARMALGHLFYERMSFNMRTVTTRKLGSKIPGMNLK